MHCVMGTGRREVIDYFLNHGIDINSTDKVKYCNHTDSILDQGFDQYVMLIGWM